MQRHCLLGMLALSPALAGASHIAISQPAEGGAQLAWSLRVAQPTGADDAQGPAPANGRLGFATFLSLHDFLNLPQAWPLDLRCIGPAAGPCAAPHQRLAPDAPEPDAQALALEPAPQVALLLALPLAADAAIPVSEPMSWALVAVALAGITATRRPRWR